LAVLSGAYFSQSLVLDPVLKLKYLDATWDDKYIKIGMDAFKAQVSLYHTKNQSYHYRHFTVSF
jgi:hypothetical protein